MGACRIFGVWSSLGAKRTPAVLSEFCSSLEKGGVAWFWRLRSTMVELLARICCAEEYDPGTFILLLPLLAVKSERAREGAN